jgi:hypothetical protein
MEWDRKVLTADVEYIEDSRRDINKKKSDVSQKTDIDESLAKQRLSTFSRHRQHAAEEHKICRQSYWIIISMSSGRMKTWHIQKNTDRWPSMPALPLVDGIGTHPRAGSQTALKAVKA